MFIDTSVFTSFKVKAQLIPHPHCKELTAHHSLWSKLDYGSVVPPVVEEEEEEKAQQQGDQGDQDEGSHHPKAGRGRVNCQFLATPGASVAPLPEAVQTLDQQ